jgi:plasmid stabilization system protein ParE
VNEADERTRAELLERALDDALARSLVAPALPGTFRRQLEAAIERSASADHALLRATIEREDAQRLAELHRGYVRLRRRTLGTLIGAAFAAGLLVTLALPLLTARFGQDSVFVLPAAGVTIGLVLSLRAWWQRSSLARLLP